MTTAPLTAPTGGQLDNLAKAFPVTYLSQVDEQFPAPVGGNLPGSSGGDVSHLWRYDVQTGELKNYGRAILESGEKSQWLWGLVEGMDGKLYICGQRSHDGQPAYTNPAVSGVFVVDPADLP